MNLDEALVQFLHEYFDEVLNGTDKPDNVYIDDLKEIINKYKGVML